MPDLARLFLHRLNCHDALYLDGAISEMFLTPGIDDVGRSVVNADGGSESRFVTMIAISVKQRP